MFDTYWRFAAARQDLFYARLTGYDDLAPHDEVLRQYRFTNCYRAADRVSQFCIRDVAYTGSQAPEEVMFRVLLFKVFNKIDTWRLLHHELGPITWRRWKPELARAVLDAAWAAGRRLYSPAYVIPPPRLGGAYLPDTTAVTGRARAACAKNSCTTPWRGRTPAGARTRPNRPPGP